MRKALDTLYAASGALAALFLAGICLIVLAQVGANVIDALATAITGRAIGLVIPSYAEFAGFFLAASSFLALAYTLHHGSHIRVSLLIHHIEGPKRRWIEAWCSAVGTGLAAYFSYFTILLVGESVEFNDVSTGMVPVALWIPQSVMATGLVVLTIALADELVAILRGSDPHYVLNDGGELTETADQP